MKIRIKTRQGMLLAAAVLLALPTWAIAADSDLQRMTPTDAHLIVWAQENPERDYQKQYMAEVWQTFQDERIVERVAEIITSNAPQDKLSKAQSVVDELKAAAKPIDWHALANAEEFVMAQVLDMPFNKTLIGVKIGSEEAAGYVQGAKQLMEIAKEKSDGEIEVQETREGDVVIVEMVLPFDDDKMPGIPFQPAVAQMGDLLLISSHASLLKQGVKQIQGDAESKFDDERLKKALAKLPAAEDSITFFDGEMLFEKLRDFGNFVRTASGDDEKGQRVARVWGAVIDQLAIFDYSVTVEFTDDYQNRSSTLGKLSDDAEDKFLFEALAQGEPFDAWQTWVPADADGYSLSTGVNLHILHQGVMEFVRSEFPESHEALDKWDAVQQEIGVNLDRDILQSFSGECVSVVLPAKARDGSESQSSVTALRCSNPEKVRELLHRGFEGLNKIEAVQAQQLQLVPCEGLEGFDQLQSPTLMMLGVTPVLGFHDGWMMMASSPEAVERVIAVRAGEADSIAGTENLQQFDLDVDGTVHAVKYTDIAKNIHGVADAIEQVGAFLPMAIGMAGAQANAEELKPVQEVVGLLPSIANVIRKFDFMEKSLNVTREGSAPMTFTVDASTLIREPTTR